MRTCTFLAVLLTAGFGLAVGAAPAAADDGTIFDLDLGADLPWFRVGTSGAIYEAPRYGGDGRLYVSEDDGWRVYRGSNYDVIVRDNPELGSNASLEVLGQKVGTGFGIDVDGPRAPSLRGGLHTRIGAPNITYERSNWDNRARVYVARNGHEYVYTGSDFDAIVQAYPHLKTHAGYTTLSKRVKTIEWQTNASPSGNTQVELIHDGDGYTLESWTWQGDDGWVRKTWTASTYAELQADTEARAVLNSMNAKTSVETTAKAGGAVLANTTHDGRACVLVQDVMGDERSIARRLTLQKGDIITAINGQKPETAQVAAKALAEANSKTNVKVRRGDQTLTLRVGAASM
jgi:hypothetical protein